MLSVTPYRESDAMVALLSEAHGLVRMVIRGYYKATSKQLHLGLEYSYVRYQSAFKTSRLNTVIGGELIESYRAFRTDFEWLSQASLFCEIIQKTYVSDSIAFYCEALHLLFSKTSSLMQVLVQYLSDLGIQPQIDHCVHCSSQQFQAFSIKDGGFLCKTHAMHHQEMEELLAIYRMFEGKNVPEALFTRVFSVLIRYFEYHNDIIIRSYELF